MTTYPLAAKSRAFQRYDHESPQAPCGPPWMRNFTGYFLLASKLGGRMMKPWTLVWAAPVNQKGSRDCMARVGSTLELISVSGTGRVQSGMSKHFICVRQISLGAS